MNNTPTPHNSAVNGEIAEIVLMTGDPRRAKYIAENFLNNAVCFNEVRGMLGYTGTYKGKKISVMGSGMGIPSIAIYSFELYKFYNVKIIIRLGSCGGYDKNLELLDTIIVDNSYSESSFAYTSTGCIDKILYPSTELTEKLFQASVKLNIKIKRGTILTSDEFDCYLDIKDLLLRIPANINCLGAEMEAFGLFHIANILNKKAACILTVVDIHNEKKILSEEDREKSLNDMIKIALESILI